MSEFFESVVKLEMSTDFNEVFERYAQIINPEGGDENLYAFDSHSLLESM